MEGGQHRVFPGSLPCPSIQPVSMDRYSRMTHEARCAWTVRLCSGGCWPVWGSGGGPSLYPLRANLVLQPQRPTDAAGLLLVRARRKHLPPGAHSLFPCFLEKSLVCLRRGYPALTASNFQKDCRTNAWTGGKHLTRYVPPSLANAASVLTLPPRRAKHRHPGARARRSPPEVSDVRDRPGV